MSKKDNSISVMITDDHPLAINGIQNILQFYPHIRIIGTYTSGNALLEALEQEQPDVLLLDILLPDITGKDLATMITQRYPSVRILALTSLDAPSHVEGMMRRGCTGYLLKNTDQHTLVAAIEQVHRGEEFMDPSLKEQLLVNMLKLKKQNKDIEHTPVLTQREKDILQLIVAEYTSQEIAEKLFISLRTVENHRFNLLQKLDAKNTVGLVKVALRMGLVE